MPVASDIRSCKYVSYSNPTSTNQRPAFARLTNHLEGESPGLVLSVHGAGEEEGRGEPEAGAQGHEHHHQGPGQLDLINHVCRI